MLDPDDPRHGTANGYHNLGCRCRPCQLAWNETHLAYMRRHPEQYARQRETMRLRRDPDGSKAKQRATERAERERQRSERAARVQRRVELRALIRDLHASGMPYNRIADLFNEKAVPTLRPGDGTRWNKGTIWHVVNDNQEET